jgi:uncharacterized alkaline shock family protein YloU
MNDFPAQTDPTTAAESTEVQTADDYSVDGDAHVDAHVDGDPIESDAVEATAVGATAVEATAPADHAGDGYAHVGNGVYQSAGSGFNGAADRVNERLHEMAGRAGEAIAQATDEAGERISGVTQAAVTRIRNNASLPASRGTTTIANEVVEKIAGIAARDVPGVYDLGGDTVRLLSSVREKLHLGEESKAQGIAVKLNGKEVDLSITIVLEYGFVVSSVTDTVREKTISAVETLLGLDVTNVDILVDDIHLDQDGPVGDDATRATGYSSGTQGITVGG